MLTDNPGPDSIAPEVDFFMICGSGHAERVMVKDCCALLGNKGVIESRNGTVGHFVIEQAFIE